MNVTTGVCLRALLDIYQAHRIRRHGMLSTRMLEIAWRSTGMRRDDLRRALAYALEHHLLQKSLQENYELTYVGEVAMLAGLQASPVRKFSEWSMLRRLRLRRFKSDRHQSRLMRRQGDSDFTSS